MSFVLVVQMKLIPAIQLDLHTSHAIAGLLATTPFSTAPRSPRASLTPET